MEEVIPRRRRPAQGGASLIEIMVTLVIISIGLLGLAGLQSKLQVNDLESYQRSQALVLVKDMSSRIAANRIFAANYVQSNIGTATCPTTTATSTRAQIDLAQWCRALRGAAEVQGGLQVGSMLGARGCVTNLGGNSYQVTVAWQGLVPVSAPPAGAACGVNQYNGAAGSSCVNDRCRRVVTTVVRVGVL